LAFSLNFAALSLAIRFPARSCAECSIARRVDSTAPRRPVKRQTRFRQARGVAAPWFAGYCGGPVTERGAERSGAPGGWDRGP
jgi:hypothetical protein